MSLSGGEVLRKLVHIGSGVFAFGLAYLSWWQAALAAFAAFAFNLFVLPRAGGGRLLRDGDRPRGYAVGILAYPLVVFVLILLFRDRLEIAAAGWAFLAFGDGLATLAGRAFGARHLSWNPSKSWVGLATYAIAGGLAGTALFGHVARRTPSTPELVALALAALVGAAVESMPSELDDNIVAPLVASLALAALLVSLPAAFDLTATARVFAGFNLMRAVGVNFVIAIGTYLLKIVRKSGAWAGFFLGTAILAAGGLPLYTLLWVFFGTGTLATRFGRARKETLGKHEPHGGRRGAAHAFANVGVAAFCAVVGTLAGERDPDLGALFHVAAAGALATAVMDTIGTEIGQSIRSATMLLPDFKRVPPGTDGAVSIAGTLAGLGAAALLSGVAVAMSLASPLTGLLIVFAAVLGTVAESLLGRDGAPWRVTNGHVLNFYNTLIGAAATFLLAGASVMQA